MLKIGAFLFTFTLLLGMASAQSMPPTTAPQTSPQIAPQTPGQAPSTTQAPANEPSPQAQARETLEKVGADLNLTADQKSRLEPVLIAEIQTVRDLRADTTTPMDQKQAKFKQMMADTHAKIDAILTPEQKQKLAQISAQRRAQQEQQATPPASTQPVQPQQPPK